jgi:hypothetical protein
MARFEVSTKAFFYSMMAVICLQFSAITLFQLTFDVYLNILYVISTVVTTGIFSCAVQMWIEASKCPEHDTTEMGT